MCWGGFLFHLGDLIEFGGFSKWWGYWRVSEVNPSTIPSLLMIDRVKAQSRRTCVFHLGFKGLWIRSSLVESPAAHLLDHPTVPSSCSRAFQLASKTDGNDNKGRQTKSIQLTRKKQTKKTLPNSWKYSWRMPRKWGMEEEGVRGWRMSARFWKEMNWRLGLLFMRWKRSENRSGPL